MIFNSHYRKKFLPLLFFFACTNLFAAPQTVPPAIKPVTTTNAEAIFAGARSRIVQVRTILKTAAQKSSTGSGFLVSADGYAITNYHVVSQHALEPDTYRMEYLAPDGSSGELKLIRFDVINDLALVKMEKTGMPFFEFDPRAVTDAMPKGERLYTLGNPLDIGFSVLEGTYSGTVDRSYNERVHLSGAMNPGMSGGPTLSSLGKIAGVNVAKMAQGAEQVSFLVPAKFAYALTQLSRVENPIEQSKTYAEIGRQLSAWQSKLANTFLELGFSAKQTGDYLAPESRATWLTCWARTNSDEKPKPRALLDSSDCNMQNGIYIAEDLRTGNIDLSQTYASSIDLNAFQFAHFLSEQIGGRGAYGSVRRLTKSNCEEQTIIANALPMRAILCSRAYRDFENIYDFSLVAVTQDASRVALISRLNMSGFSFDAAMKISQRFLGEIKKSTAQAAIGVTP